jgi:hypothetical protein
MLGPLSLGSQKATLFLLEKNNAGIICSSLQVANIFRARSRFTEVINGNMC